MRGPGPSFPNDSTLPLLAAFLLAVAFLGIVVAIGLSDGSDAAPRAAETTDTIAINDTEVIPQVTLTLDTAGAGKGTVRVAGEDRVCSAECKFTLDRETSVTIIARAAQDARFVSWTGSCGGQRICTIYLDRSRAITALFTERTPSAGLAEPASDCGDGADNDADGFVDEADPECLVGKTEAGDRPDLLLDDEPIDPPPAGPPSVTPPPVVVPPPPAQELTPPPPPAPADELPE